MNPYPDTSGCGDQTPGCDLAGIDSLGCKVEGVTAEAEYLKGFQSKITERRAQFDTTRSSYQSARDTVAAQREIIKEKLAKLREQLCQVGSDDRACLDAAWDSVRTELAACGSAGGCCVARTDRAVDDGVPGGEAPAPEAVKGVITRLEAQADRVERCFDTLVKEPGDLTKRATDLDAAVSKIQPNKDPVQAYAETLWAEYRLETLSGGFDSPAAFEDCLCTALMLSLDLRQRLAKLAGRAAELTCHQQKEKARCDWLRGSVVNEIVARCRRRQPATTTS